MILSDLGAEVTKVEQPGVGDYMRLTPPTLRGLSPVHAMVNKNKSSIGLDLKRPEGREILRRMLKDSSVFIEGFRPGAIERLGFSFEAVKKVNSRIVYCSLSAFGHANPMSANPGHDINFQAMSGALGSESEPRVPYLQIADLCAGMYAAIGILGALASERRGAVYIDVPIVQSLMSLLIIPVSSYLASGVSPRVGHSLLFGSEPHYNLYRTADGRSVAVGAIEVVFWENLLREVGLTELRALTGSEAERASVTRKLAETFAKKTRDEWARLLMRKETCVTPVLDLEDVLNSRWVTKGRVSRRRRISRQMLGSPLSFAPASTSRPRGAPALGEQTNTIMRRLGYGKERINELRQREIIE